MKPQRQGSNKNLLQVELGTSPIPQRPPSRVSSPLIENLSTDSVDGGGGKGGKKGKGRKGRSGNGGGAPGASSNVVKVPTASLDSSSISHAETTAINEKLQQAVAAAAKQKADYNDMVEKFRKKEKILEERLRSVDKEVQLKVFEALSGMGARDNGTASGRDSSRLNEGGGGSAGGASGGVLGSTSNTVGILK